MRRLLRAPFFTTIAITTLALGIGANAAIFSVVHGVLLQPLPFHQPDRLVAVWHTAPGLNMARLNQSPATYLTYREEGRVFDEIGLWSRVTLSVTDIGEPERVAGLRGCDGLLRVLGVFPLLGRSFTADDDRYGAPNRLMLSHGYWQRKLGGDPAAIGRRLSVDGESWEIIGVLPAGFRFGGIEPQVLLPFRFNRAEIVVGQFSYMAVARLRSGVTVEQANADIARMLPLVLERFALPAGFSRQMVDEARIGPLVRPLTEDVIGEVGSVLWILLGMVGIVLFIACANVANLFLVRAEGRQRELAIHAALGASRVRVVWELLSESLLLAAAGGALGLLLAHGGVRTIAAMAPDSLPRVENIGIDGTVVAFTAAIALLAGLLFGLLPILRSTRPHLANALKDGGRASSDGRSRHAARNALVIAEIALAVVLLVASGLMIRTFQALRDVDPGFVAPAELLSFRVSIPASLVPDGEQAVRMHQQTAQRLAQVPGVQSVGLASSITMEGTTSADTIFVEDFPIGEGRIAPLRRFKWVGEGYFETMGNRLVAGRALTWHDAFTRADVVVVTENFAREYWQEPVAALGRRIRETPRSPWRTIVGVVADVRDAGLAQPAPAIVYWPMIVWGMSDDSDMIARHVAYVVRSRRTGSPTLLAEVQNAVWSVNAQLPLARVRTLEAIQAESMAQTSFALVVLAIAASVSLVLGIVGLYGVISYVAAERTREIGIRLALGATPRAVTRLFLRQALALAAAGIMLGLGAAWAVTRLMQAMLFGVSTTDPVTYVAVAGGLAVTALVASYMPAARAARTDPAAAVRTT